MGCEKADFFHHQGSEYKKLRGFNCSGYTLTGTIFILNKCTPLIEVAFEVDAHGTSNVRDDYNAEMGSQMRGQTHRVATTFTNMLICNHCKWGGGVLK
ncbi:hypothetical protein C5167_048711 [Papaver somniferum]|uniref:Uncharacterized protein n=1 Tax=Papaver somniferum TaxID=3469 RepID=A0A4Y7KM35_PAPSO|nr:hypothetical protein C5167_048711 [Papaver somniferum]